VDMEAGERRVWDIIACVVTVQPPCVSSQMVAWDAKSQGVGGKLLYAGIAGLGLHGEICTGGARPY